MTITFIYPLALWLLVLVPLTVALALSGPRRPTSRRFWGGLVLRVVLLTLIVLALAGIQVRLRSSVLTVVFLMDASDSLPPEQQARSEAFISQAVQQMPSGDRAAIVVFGQDALVERLASEGNRLQELTSVPVTVRTDISSAIQLGLALFPDEGARRMVLLSDGRENVGRALDQAALAAAHDVELRYVPLGGAQGEAEVLVEGLDAPADVRKGQGFDLRVSISSTGSIPAVLRVFGDGQLIHTQELLLSAGTNRYVVPVQADETGFRRFRAQVVPDLDTRLQNNEASAFTVVSGPARVVVVEGQAGEGDNLTQALQSAEMEVRQVSPAELPTGLAELAAYDAVVLVDVPAEALPIGAMENLQVYVRDLGKGLLMSGGETAFGAGGYLRTALEETLPVDMDVRTRQETPNIAMVLAVDKSGSMGRCHCDDPDLAQTYERVDVGQPKVDIAKAAIMEAASALGPQDYLGVVAFDSMPSWAVEVRQVVDALALEQSIGGIQAQGDTNVYAGVEAAYQALTEQQARIKHVVLLTDGWVTGGNLVALAHEMEQQGITLSVVAAGSGSAEYLEDLALQGGGRYYPAIDILRVPEFFLKETVKAVGRYIIEEPFYPLPVDSSSPVLSGLNVQTLPALFGYNGTTPKTTARVLLGSARGDPLLATWQYGLGRAAVWTSDMKGQWAREWVSWGDFSRFAAQLVGWTLPAPKTEGLEASAALSEGEALLSLEAYAPDGQPRNFLQVNARLVGPDLEVRQVALAQVGAGRYEAGLDADQPGTYLAQIEVRQDDQQVGQQTLGLVVPYSPEYRASGTDLALLEELAGLTGGGELPEPVEAFLHNLPSADRAREIWMPLLLVAALLFPLDVAVRRVMLSSRDFRKAVLWVEKRLGIYLLRPREAGQAAPPVLGELFQARDRARQRAQQRSRREDAAGEAMSESQARKPLQDQAQPGEGAKSEPESPESADTFARLREARRRRRRED